MYLQSVTTEQTAQVRKIIWVDPERMSGAPCFKGIRVPVQCLIDYIEGNSTLEEFFADYPSVSRDQVFRFLELAKVQLIELPVSKTDSALCSATPRHEPHHRLHALRRFLQSFRNV